KILALQEGGLLIATNKSLLYYADNTIRRLNLRSLPLSLTQLDNGDIYVGTEAFMGLKGKLADLLAVPLRETLVVGLEFKAVIEDFQQNVLVAWMSGLNKIDAAGKESSFDENNLLYRSGVNDLQASQDSTLWIATNGSGLVIKKAGQPPFV
ncbi:MAG: hypothetical protein AAFQ68_23935, partial [Bacteroidota bacterium]